jgi:hypothetical protein
MNAKMRTKIIKELKDEIISIQELSKIVKFRTNKNLQKFIDTVNEMYNNDELLSVTMNQERCLMLVRK